MSTLRVNEISARTGTGDIQVVGGRIISPGSVIQVVQAQLSTQPSAASAVFVDTGLSVGITPTSATSKVLVLATGIMSSSNGAPNVGIGRNDLQPNTNGLPFVSAQADYSWSACSWPFSLSVLDSPDTDGLVTYKLKFRSASGTVYLNRSPGIATELYSAVSTIIAMEIAQ